MPKSVASQLLRLRRQQSIQNDLIGNVGSKKVDETNIGDEKILQFNEYIGKVEYTDRPTGGGFSYFPGGWA